MILTFTSLGEKEYEEGPMAGKKLPKPVQLLGFLLTGATVVSNVIVISVIIMIGIVIITAPACESILSYNNTDIKVSLPVVALQQLSK